MPEIRENTIGNKICQLFIEQQAPADRILAHIYTDVTSKQLPGQGHVQELLSTSPCLLSGVTGTEGTGLYPAMYSTKSIPVPISNRRLVLQEAKIDARNYILKFVDKDKNDCWMQVRELTILLPCCLDCA